MKPFDSCNYFPHIEIGKSVNISRSWKHPRDIFTKSIPHWLHFNKINYKCFKIVWTFGWNVWTRLSFICQIHQLEHKKLLFLQIFVKTMFIIYDWILYQSPVYKAHHALFTISLGHFPFHLLLYCCKLSLVSVHLSLTSCIYTPPIW